MRFFTLNPPVHIKTVGGGDATITSIESDPPDIFIGILKAPAGTFNVSWDENGFCRNMEPTANLDPGSGEFQALLKEARELGL